MFAFGNIFNNKFYRFSRCSLFSLVLSRTNCYRASIARTHRKLYLREYKTTLVLPDGATLPLRYPNYHNFILVILNDNYNL